MVPSSVCRFSKAFGYPIHRAVGLNIAITLATLVATVAFRMGVTAVAALGGLLSVILGLIAGSMLGAWVGPAYTGRISAQRLERLILVLLVALGGVLIAEAFVPWRSAGLPPWSVLRGAVAVALGFGIGVVSSTLGVAGGELIIPTLVFVFGADMKLAGTASALISFPAVCLGVVPLRAPQRFRPRIDVPADRADGRRLRDRSVRGCARDAVGPARCASCPRSGCSVTGSPGLNPARRILNGSNECPFGVSAAVPATRGPRRVGSCRVRRRRRDGARQRRALSHPS